MASTIPVANETTSSASRITKEGKKITYKLNVIQQPERARACGSGAKSSADRRPVDPPPIVELRVYENGEEITFSYNANFFLFATLENARNIAQGRVPQSPSSFPVLTGTPVAGMAYLDRPSPAGYFIFPDLSVRHEGKYRLSFSLYEELKEQKDMDTEEIANLEVLAQTSQHVSHRLEVKSVPFTVFSAKKFPGLTESTALSRMVAEQGCRVRIRRDVRMRRRENKSSKEWDDDYEDPATMEHARQSRTPDAYAQQSTMPTPQATMDGSDRPRSVSNASVASYSVPRRPSMEQMGQGYQQSYPQISAPQASQTMYPPQMGYSAPPPQQQYQAPYQQPQQAMMQPPQVPYPSQAQQYAPQPPQQVQMQQNYGYMPQQQYSQPPAPPPQPAYDQTAHHVRHNSLEYPTTPSDYRRSSMPQQPTHSQAQSYSSVAPPTSAPFGQIETAYTPTTQASFANSPTDSGYQSNWNPNSNWGSRRSTMTSVPPSLPTSMATSHPPLAPLRTLHSASQKLEPVSPPYHTPPHSLPLSAESVHSPGYNDISRTAPPVFSNTMQPQVNGPGKRSYSASFDTHHMEQPLRYGARPNVNSHEEEYAMHAHYEAGSDAEPTAEESAMSYRRADGTERRRRIPLSN